MIYLGQTYPVLLVAAAQPAGRIAVCRGPEPQGGEPDAELGKIGSDGGAKLSRTKVEDKLDLPQLEATVKAIAEVKTMSVFSGSHSRSAETDFRLHPELETIRDLDNKFHKEAGCQHYHLYYYLLEENSYWNNAITLLSVLAQKHIEADNKKGIEQAIDYCRFFRARIEQQKNANKYLLPVKYYLAVLDQTEAELKAQVKKQSRQYYEEARALAIRSINTLSGLSNNKYFWSSEADYFTISKSLLVLGDLNIKLKEVVRREIAQLRHRTINIKAEGQKVKTIEQLEAEASRLVQDAYAAYGALANVDQGFSLKLPGIEFSFSRAQVDAALASNTSKGFIEKADAEEASKGIFQYFKAIARLRKNALLPQLRRPIKEPELIQALQETDAAIGELNGLLQELQAKAAAEKDPARRAILQKRVAKMETGFYLLFGGLVRADLTLALLDRMNYSVAKRGRPEWEYFLQTVRAATDLLNDTVIIKGEPVNAKNLSGQIEAKLNGAQQGKTLEELRFSFTRLVTEIAKRRYKSIQNELKDHPFRLKYLYGWAAVKLIEIAARSADYVEFDHSRKAIGKANIHIHECEQLKRRWLDKRSVPDQYQRLFDNSNGNYSILKEGAFAAAKKAKPADPALAQIEHNLEAYFDDEEYLGIELAYLESIFYSYHFDPDIPGTADSPGAINRLAARVKASADYLPEEQRVYFTVYALLKEGVAQIESNKPKDQKFKAAAAIMEKVRAQVDGEPSKLDPYLDPLAWDIHALKAELFHQLAIAYSWIEKGKPALESNRTGYYNKRAYQEIAKSTSIYDRLFRKDAMEHDLKLDENSRKIHKKPGPGNAAEDDNEVIR